MKKNPFKFGSVVDVPFFINRKEEIEKVVSILNSDNHLIVISPRRFGKTSLIKKVISKIDRPSLYLDLQLITNGEDFASQLLKRLYRIYTFEKVKELIKNFRVLPSISLNPLNNEVEISFQRVSSTTVLIEDVLNLIERISKKNKKIIVVLDEFQEIKNIDKNFEKKLRATIQHHQKINYVFLGSQESLMRDIFEKKNSPFYHFGYLLPLEKIPYMEFFTYLVKSFSAITKKNEEISKEILNITKSHPFYTQQLAFTIFEFLIKDGKTKNIVEDGVVELVRIHDMDYERLWNRLNRTDMKVLIGMTFTEVSPLSTDFNRLHFIGSSSTIFSSLKRLMQHGVLIKTDFGYEIDDPFFKRWIKVRRGA